MTVPAVNVKQGAALPLAGRRVVVTRATEQAGGFVRMLESAGADVVEFPTIKTVPPESWEGVDRAVAGLSGFGHVLFTSANAVKYFMARMAELGHEPGELSGHGIIVVGPRTAAELGKYGLKPTVTPAEFKAEGVIEALSGMDMKGRRVLFPRAEVAREILPEKLAGMGAEVVVAVSYRTVAPDVAPEYIRELFAGGKVSAITFTSSSTVTNFAAMAGGGVARLLEGVCVAAIGPVTADTCREVGLSVTVMPEDYTVEALLDVLTGYFKREKV
ncbi:MAG: uroporphyrinogen-III synthase [Nitrospirae bacterium]|nr:uroporphyrinogen-III synthase [Nitrospirota bacterium]MBI5696073.1 uroporphyrinogen-III synthase [Nitrospirota bacterium]